MFNILPRPAPTLPAEEDVPAEIDEPPERKSQLHSPTQGLPTCFERTFSKNKMLCDRKTSLLTSALHTDAVAAPEQHSDVEEPVRGLSCVSAWSNHSTSTAELTSDGGLTSPARTSTPSPPLPRSAFPNMVPVFNKKPFARPVSVARHDEEQVGPMDTNSQLATSGENGVEVTLGRKRCITFACAGKTERKAAPEPAKVESQEAPKRACTIKFACPTKISTAAPCKDPKPRAARAVSPAPASQRFRSSSMASSASHRGSDSTLRNASPVTARKSSASNRVRRLSTNAELVRTEAYRFHEFASSEEEVDEWTEESTCHRRPLTVKDTFGKENTLRKLGEEAEAEALEDDDDDEEEAGMMVDEEDEEDVDGSDAEGSVSDEGFMTDDEQGFAVSDDESDAGSDYNWWTPGYSTAATSTEHLEHIRPMNRRSMSESSLDSVQSNNRFKHGEASKHKKSRPVNIRIPSPELPDSTDFVCGTLDEDRPLEDAYMIALERRRAAKRKTPQDIDPTFPQSDPEMEEEDDEDEVERQASESDAHFMLPGQMDPVDGEVRGRRKSSSRRSPAISPKRFRSPPPPTKRTTHRSPPPRKLFGQSPRRLRSPPAPVRLRSPPPTRRGSAFAVEPKHPGMKIQFAKLAERPDLLKASSLPRTPVTAQPTFLDDEDEETPNEMPVRRAIDIKVGLEKKRQRRKEQLYRKLHRKGTKEKRPAPGKGCERMREVGLGLAAHKGKVQAGFVFDRQARQDHKDMHVLSV